MATHPAAMIQTASNKTEDGHQYEALTAAEIAERFPWMAGAVAKRSLVNNGRRGEVKRERQGADSPWRYVMDGRAMDLIEWHRQNPRN